MQLDILVVIACVTFNVLICAFILGFVIWLACNEVWKLHTTDEAGDDELRENGFEIEMPPIV